MTKRISLPENRQGDALIYYAKYFIFHTVCYEPTDLFGETRFQLAVSRRPYQ